MGSKFPTLEKVLSSERPLIGTASGLEIAKKSFNEKAWKGYVNFLKNAEVDALVIPGEIFTTLSYTPGKPRVYFELREDLKKRVKWDKLKVWSLDEFFDAQLSLAGDLFEGIEVPIYYTPSRREYRIIEDILRRKLEEEKDEMLSLGFRNVHGRRPNLRDISPFRKAELLKEASGEFKKRVKEKVPNMKIFIHFDKPYPVPYGSLNFGGKEILFSHNFNLASDAPLVNALGRIRAAILSRKAFKRKIPYMLLQGNIGGTFEAVSVRLDDPYKQEKHRYCYVVSLPGFQNPSIGEVFAAIGTGSQTGRMAAKKLTTCAGVALGLGDGKLLTCILNQPTLEGIASGKVKRNPRYLVIQKISDTHVGIYRSRKDLQKAAQRENPHAIIFGGDQIHARHYREFDIEPTTAMPPELIDRLCKEKIEKVRREATRIKNIEKRAEFLLHGLWEVNKIRKTYEESQNIPDPAKQIQEFRLIWEDYAMEVVKRSPLPAYSLVQTIGNHFVHTMGPSGLALKEIPWEPEGGTLDRILSEYERIEIPLERALKDIAPYKKRNLTIVNLKEGPVGWGRIELGLKGKPSYDVEILHKVHTPKGIDFNPLYGPRRYALMRGSPGDVRFVDHYHYQGVGLMGPGAGTLQMMSGCFEESTSYALRPKEGFWPPPCLGYEVVYLPTEGPNTGPYLVKMITSEHLQRIVEQKEREELKRFIKAYKPLIVRKIKSGEEIKGLESLA
jgi:hypothetical protein